MKIDEFDRPSFDSNILARLENTEDSFVERKEQVQPTRLRRTAVAFANSLREGHEGVIFFGVRDNGHVLPPGAFVFKAAEKKARDALREERRRA
jgi:predicted HTH transcriptional regulator